MSGSDLPELLKSIGVDPAGITETMCYSAVTREDRPHYGRSFDTVPDDSYMTNDILFSFGSGMTVSQNRIGIHAGRKEYSVGETGVNLVVYDPVTKMVVDNVNIDLDTKEIRRT